MQEQTGYLTAGGGVGLFFRFWRGREPPRGHVVIVHGANEHSGRYRHVAEFLVQHGLEVAALDQRGHGRSDGPRCHVDRFGEYLDDLRQFVGMVAQRAGDQRRPIMIGHSLGGLIAFSYAVAHPASIAALVVSSPWFALRMKVSRVERALAPVISRLLPRLQRPANILPEQLSRDPEVVRAYREDPLVGTTATPRWFVECSRAAWRARHELADRLSVPALFLQGEDDRVVDPEATRAVFEGVTYGRKALRLYPGRYHEIFNDPGHEEVFRDIIEWLDAQGLLGAKRLTAV
ncbi:MAG: lysophospholipase [Bacillota bacterium]